VLMEGRGGLGAQPLALRTPGQDLSKCPAGFPDACHYGPYCRLQVAIRVPQGRCWPCGHGTQQARAAVSPADGNLAGPRQEGARKRTKREPANDFTNKS
jgi:hypothetical protein